MTTYERGGNDYTLSSNRVGRMSAQHNPPFDSIRHRKC